mgnify:CR=1 FL=1
MCIRDRHRLLHEYGASCRYENIPVHKACWVSGDKAEIDQFKKERYRSVAKDKHGQTVFLADSAFALQMVQDKYKNVQFHFKSEF